MDPVGAHLEWQSLIVVDEGRLDSTADVVLGLQNDQVLEPVGVEFARALHAGATATDDHYVDLIEALGGIVEIRADALSSGLN